MYFMHSRCDILTSVLLLFFCEASLIRGNRANCALFCDNLDWLVSKLDRLEASSGIRCMKDNFNVQYAFCFFIVLSKNEHVYQTVRKTAKGFAHYFMFDPFISRKGISNVTISRIKKK